MKKIFAIIAALVFSGAFSAFGAETRHTLTSLWSEYGKYSDADLPKKSMDVLSRIKKEASQKKLPYDFYDAALAYVDVATGRNWKLRDSLVNALNDEVHAFGMPALEFYHMASYKYESASVLGAFAEKNRKELSASKLDLFYKDYPYSYSLGGFYDGIVVERIKNDYEMALWAVFMRSFGVRYGSNEKTGLESYMGDRYPECAVIDYAKACNSIDGETCEKAMKEGEKKYAGKAASLMFTDYLFSTRFSKLDSDVKSDEKAFKSFYEECRAFEKKRASFSGDEKKIAGLCTRVEGIIDELESKFISLGVSNDTLTVSLRNLSSASIKVLDKDEKEVFSSTVRNGNGSFYVMDTLKLYLGPLDDGDYTILAKNGETGNDLRYEKKTISVAYRQGPKGKQVYLAEFMTGKPVTKADVRLVYNEKTVVEATGVSFNGFTYLPASFSKYMKSSKKSCTLEFSTKDASGRVMKSSTIYVYSDFFNDGPAVTTPNDYDYAKILLDCGAFHPGDKVRFKAILYRGNPETSYRTFASGRSVEAQLVDSNGNLIERKALKTNDMGSVASEFKLDNLPHNGRCRIKILYNGNLVAQTSFVVDDYVLPTYEIKFENPPKPYFLGDHVIVKGSVTAYSGHSLSGADIRYELTGWSEEDSKSGVLELDSKGSFAIEFDAKSDCGWYNVVVKVVDNTGETHESGTSVSVCRNIHLSSILGNASQGLITATGNSYKSYENSILSSPTAELIFRASAEGMDLKDCEIEYSVSFKGEEILKGKAANGEKTTIPMEREGEYLVASKATVKDDSGKDISTESKLRIVRVGENSTRLEFECENFFRKLPGTDAIRFQIGGTAGPVWAIAELFDVYGRFVASQAVHLDSEKESLKTVSFPFEKSYGSALSLRVFYFRNATSYQWSDNYSAPAASLELPFSFSRFTDLTNPGTTVKIGLSSRSNVEICAAVFDKSTTTIDANYWYGVNLSGVYASAPWISVHCGKASAVRPIYRTYGNGGILMKSAARAGMVMSDDCAVEEEALCLNEAPQSASVEVYDALEAEADVAGVQVRKDFADVLAFEPFLRTDASGNAEFVFDSSDKLSTYIVSVFAHDKDMYNATLRKEMVVSIPVKVAVVEPQILFEGDKYVVSAGLSSNSDSAVSGTMYCLVYDADNCDGTALSSYIKKISVEPGSTAKAEFPIDVPAGFGPYLGVKVVFVADKAAGGDFSDAVFVSAPVREARQTITEAHSGVLLAGMDSDKLLSDLRAQFTGTSSYGAEYSERTVRDMVIDAIPTKVNPDSDNSMSLSSALYARAISRSLGVPIEESDEDIISKLLACRNSDGGFAWFEGLSSSPVITAVILNRFYRMGLRSDLDRRLGETIEGAVKFLDRSYFKAEKRPYWYGWISLEQYLYVRSEFAYVGFGEKTNKEFRKAAKDFLTPKKSRKQGYVYAKVRRAYILYNLTLEGGEKLAKAWGFGSTALNRIRKSLDGDILSLEEYAVAHKNGGIYYPNMVSPYGGLLESQLYSHVVLCNLSKLSGRLAKEADGVRLWMMLQKETQQWSDDPAYVDAVASVLDGSDDLMKTKVMILTKTYSKPFSEIVPAGNDMTVERKFYRVGKDGKKVEIAEGAALSLGERITAEYRITSNDIRSFVKLTSPRPGCLRPVDQLSGHYGWRFGLISCVLNGRSLSLSPSGYRDSRTDRSEYWFDCFPEDKTVITEEFYVTQKGVFSIPAMTVECLYAPHYRANGNCGTLISE